MTALIMTLISIIGYGTPQDFEHLPLEVLEVEVERADAHAANGSATWDDWDVPMVDDDQLRQEAGWPNQ